MMHCRLLIGALVVSITQTAAASTAPVYPSGSSDTTAPTMVAFYQAQCADYAGRQGLSGPASDGFQANCQKEAAEIWPAGTVEPGPGE